MKKNFDKIRKLNNELACLDWRFLDSLRKCGDYTALAVTAKQAEDIHKQLVQTYNELAEKALKNER